MADGRLKTELADIREFVRLFKEGDWDEAVEGFRCLVDRILRLTIMDDRCYVRTVRNADYDDSPRMLAGPDGPEDPLLLNNGGYLRFIADLSWDGKSLTVAESTFSVPI